jgi:hypothetical protein
MLSIQVEKKDGGDIFKIQGDAVIKNALDTCGKFNEIISQTKDKCFLDISGIKEADISFIQTLISLKISFDKRHKELNFIYDSKNNPVFKVLKDIGYNDDFLFN